MLNPEDIDVINKLGNSYKGLGEPKLAIEQYEKILKINDKEYAAVFNIGLCKADLDDMDGAIDSFLKTIELEPNFDYSYYALALAYEKKGDFDNAIIYNEKYLGLITDSKLKATIKSKIEELKAKSIQALSK